jgi:hypothetical protein
MRSGVNAMTSKGNVVLYLDRELVEKSKELGFNLSKTFENHLKQLMTQFSTCNSVNNFESSENKMEMVGLAGFEPTTFTRKQRLAAPTGFSKTAPELRHPMRSANPLLAFWSPSSYLSLRLSNL